MRNAQHHCIDDEILFALSEIDAQFNSSQKATCNQYEPAKLSFPFSSLKTQPL